MALKLTKMQLLNLLTSRGSPRVKLPDGRVGTVQSVQREDGSGRCFNIELSFGTSFRQDPITGCLTAITETIFAQTTD